MSPLDGDRHDEWTDLLSDHLDGALPPERARRLEAHLRECAACSRVLAELGEVVSRARRLEDRPPDRDLWPAVREALGAASSPLRIGPAAPRPPARDRWPLGRRRVTLSLAQLSAAAVFVTLLAGSVAWSLRPTLEGTDAAVSGDPVTGTFAGSTVGEGAGGAAAELDLLERTLADGRDRLSPHTLRILEKNLDLIDRAIREATEALEVDPENPFLEEHLRRAQARRAEYLREANALLEAAD